MRKRIVVPAGLFALAGVSLVVAWAAFLRPNLPPAERGRRLAERTGCFACHGPEGSRGNPDPGRKYPEAPNLEGDVMMFAEDPGDIRQWIRDGATEKRAASKSWRENRDRGVYRMPAFGDRFDDGELGDLVAFVLAVSASAAPEDSLPLAGMDRARELGCFGCHGPGGRFARPNPGSLKGYVPSWDGRDFPDLVRGPDEFTQWVENGVSDRFTGNRFARFFLDRAALHMPAYTAHLDPGDTAALWAYVVWLRAQPRP